MHIMLQRSGLLLLAGLFALFASLTVGSGRPVFADSCDSEETALEECVLTDFGAGNSTERAPGAQGSATTTASGAAAPAIAPIATTPPPPSLRIWTDRKAYYLGDPMQVCFRVPARGNIQIIDLMPDGSRTVLWSWYDDGKGDCMQAYITPPTGTECLLLRYEDTRIYFAPGGPVPAAAPIEGIRPSPRFLYAKTCFQTAGEYWGGPYPVDFPPPPYR
jgi:hypothetical protein